MAKRELRFFVGVAFVLFLCLPGGVLAQSTIHVPADAATIQAAINAANNGDTVLVAPGTYPENINFSGKSITVESSAGPAQTTIVGQINGAVGGQTDAATVTFSSGETRSSVISGFTISTAIFSPPSASNGIYIFEANPTITNNIITNSTSYGISLYWGGALISGNTISNTSTDASQGPICDGYTGSGIGGGGSSFLFDIEIVNNIIENNVACEGGGIYLDGPPETTITNNIIRNNQGLTAGGGIYMENVRTFPIIVAQNLVYGNFATEGGGGMDISIPATSIPNPMGPLNFLIASNTITGNSISPNPTDTMDYGNGSQIEFDAYVSQVGMFNNIITSADSYATIACNPAFDYLSLEPPVADYNDIVNSSGPQFGGWCTTPAGGTGNISAGPQFSNAAQNNYQPAAGSPVIDTGFNAAPGIQPLDFNGNPRIQNATGITAATVDMGAYELSGVRDDREATLTSFSVNPANPTYGQNATFSADVTATEGVSAGTVTFLDDWTPIGQSNVNTSGLTTLTTSQLAAGTHWIVAEYGGTTGLDQSVSAADSVTVQGIATTTTVTVSPNPVYSSQPVTISANVSSALGGLSGTISFVDYFEYLPNPLGSLPIYANGTASITVSTLPDETNDIEAVYSGDSGHASSTSSPVALSVQDFFADASAQYPTIKAGQTGTGTIFVEPYGGLTGTITFTCTTPSTMYGASCSASPIQLNGTPVETTTFSISTTSPAAAELSSAARTRDGRFPFLWSGSFLLICFSARGRRSHFLFLILLIPLTLASVSCGGGSGGATIPTQPGTYAIIFNGTIGPISHSFGSTVVVQ
jgi:hypothetical protein